MKIKGSVTLAIMLLSSLASAEVLPVGEADFLGKIKQQRDLSAVQPLGDFLLIASDETTAVDVLKRESENVYQFGHRIPLLKGSSTEIDMEAMAWDGGSLYVLGSHAWLRSRVKDDKSQAKNKQRLATVKHEASRDLVFRFDVDPETGERSSKVESRSLRTLFANHPVLHLFARIPSKENGIDFEGLAVADERLYFGMRGPVLRGNYVPVLVMKFDDIEQCSIRFAGRPERCRILYLDLDGLGIRSLQKVKDGFLLIAGPVGDGAEAYSLYFWDGRDCLPDGGSAGCTLRSLGEVPAPEGTKAEGLAVLDETGGAWEVLVVYDGAKRGAPARYRVTQP